MSFATLLEPPATVQPGPSAVPPTGSRSLRPPNSWWVLGAFLLVALGFLLFSTANYRAKILDADRLESALRHREAGGPGVCEPFAQGRPPTQFDPDGLCWVNLTQRQWEQGVWRSHDNPFDNAPAGRERHWSSSLSWWLLLTGGLTHLCTGQPMEAAIADSAPWANPVLFGLFLAVTGWLLRRRLDAWSTGIFLVTLATSWHVQWDFSYGRSDHHGLHLMAFTGMILSALIAGLGWVKEETRPADAASGAPGQFLVRPATGRHARFWFVVSGGCGAAGLWIGATQQCFGIAALGSGAVLGAWCFARSGTPGARFDPALWRRWARVGAAASLGFYLLEYFPSHLAMHLEVNHPLMSLAWLGAGEVMFVLILARLDWRGTRARWRQHGLRAALGLAAMSLLPLALKLGPKSWWVINDPITKRTLSTVSEFQPWLDFSHPDRALIFAWNFLGMILLAIPLAMLILGWRRRLPPWRRMALVVGLTVCLVFLGWTLAQVRWKGFLECSLAALAVLVAPCLFPADAPGRRTTLPLCLLALTVPGWLNFAWSQNKQASSPAFVNVSEALRVSMACREVAWNLRLAVPGTQTVRVMSPFSDSPPLHYYDPRVQTVGSFYWENIAGCQTGIDFYNDEGDAVARRIAREHHLDYVVVVSNPATVLHMQIYSKGYRDISQASRTLMYRLANPTVQQAPAWLEPVTLVEAPVARQEGYRLYRVRRDLL